MDRVTSIDPFGKTREAPASGSFSILRRSVTAPRPLLAGRSTPFVASGRCRSAAGPRAGRRCIGPLGRKGGRHFFKNDNLSFLRVGLAQMDSVQGGTNGLTPLFEGGRPGPSRVLLFDLQQCAWPTPRRCAGALPLPAKARLSVRP